MSNTQAILKAIEYANNACDAVLGADAVVIIIGPSSRLDLGRLRELRSGKHNRRPTSSTPRLDVRAACGNAATGMWRQPVDIADLLSCVSPHRGPDSITTFWTWWTNTG
ncbi:MAG: hypothetical protein GY788_01900 [bacterium]|nr:hypothetical protein [bacterium]